MKIVLFVALTSITSETHADVNPVTNFTSSTISTAPSLLEQGANHQTWIRTTTFTNASRRVIYHTNKYKELATGLNFRVGDRWLPSSPAIQITQNGAVVTNTSHPIYFAVNLNSLGAVDMLTPNAQHMSSHIMGLAYFDASTSNGVLFAPLQDSYGQILPSSTQAIYTNAFSGYRADVLYLSTRAGLEQDIVLREQLPSPEQWNLNSQTTWLQVWTEFTSTPVPQIKVLTNGNAGWRDDDLEFGTMHIGRGRAFAIGNQAMPTRVYKHWRIIEGRSFLIEEVPLSSLTAQLQSLPGSFYSPSGSNSTPQNTGGKSSTALKSPRVVSLASNPQALLLPPPIRMNSTANNPMRLATVTPSQKGYVLDYHAMDSTETDFTFQSDTTYFVSGEVYLSGTTTFEGGTVVKYSSDPSATLVVSNPLWKTAPYRPAIFTSMDDNSVGESIGSGDPTSQYYGGIALDLSAVTSPFLSNARFSYLNNMLSASVVTLQDVQINQCQTVFADDNNMFYLHNVLAWNIGTFCSNNGDQGGKNGDDSGHTLIAVNVTLDNCNILMADPTSSVFLTNSLFIGVTQWGAYIFNNVNSEIQGGDFGVFQSMGAANFYLADGSSYRGAGTTSIDPATLADIQQKTTSPPTVYADQVITDDLILNPQVPRDNSGSAVDIGYHYDPIDYAFGGTLLENAAVTVNPGTVLAGFDDSGSGYGLTVGPGAQFRCQGTPLALIRFVNYNTVQEETSSSSWRTPVQGILQPNSTADEPGSYLYCRFVDFSILGQDTAHIFNISGDSQPLALQDCQFHGGLLYTTNTTFNLTNCLLERVSATLNSLDGGAPQIRNSLYWNGSLNLFFASANGLVQNNEFYRTAITDTTGVTYNSGYNAYYATSAYLNQASSQDVILTDDPGFEVGPLGNYYQSSGLLIDKGSTTADQLGLYHYTSQINQANEAGSMVDIGYHYIGVDLNGNPMDTDGDGLPDYVEDANGNGLYEPGIDLSDWQNAFTDGSGMDDGWEVKYFGGINVDPYADPDGDGYDNLEEYLKNTNPLVFNSPPKGVPSIQALHDQSNPANINVTWQSVPSATSYTITRTINGSVTTYNIPSGTSSWTDNSVPAGSSPSYAITANYPGGGSADSSPAGNPDYNPTLAVDSEIIRGPTPSNPALTPLQIILKGQVPAGIATLRVYKYISPAFYNYQYADYDWQIGFYYGDLGWSETELNDPPYDGYFDVPITSFQNGVYQISTGQAMEWCAYYFETQPIGNDGRGGVVNNPVFARNVPFVDGSQNLTDNLAFILRAGETGNSQPYDPALVDFEANPNYAAVSPVIQHMVVSEGDNGDVVTEVAPFNDNWFMRNWAYDTSFEQYNGGSYYYFYWDKNLDQYGGNSASAVKYQFDGFDFINNSDTSLLASQINGNPLVYLGIAYPDELGFFGSPADYAGLSWNSTQQRTELAPHANFYGLQYASVRVTQSKNPLTVQDDIPAGGSYGDPTPNDYSEYFQNVTAPSLTTVGYYFTQAKDISTLEAGTIHPMPNDGTFTVSDTTPLILAAVGQPTAVYGWAKQQIANGASGKYGYLGQYFDPTSVQGLGAILSEYGDFFATQPGEFTIKTKPDISTGQQGACTVNTISLNVDANHDNSMDLTYGGPDTTSPTVPMNFWINNGSYGTGVGQLIDAKTVVPDYTYGQIRSQFGLENFARLWICGVPALPSGQGYTVTMSCKSVSGSPGINLYAVSDGSTAYLSDPATASALVGLQTLGMISQYRTYTFPADYFDGSNKYFVFEGTGIGEGQFTLTILQNGNVVAQSSVWLNLQDVKAMYQRAAATPDDVSFTPPYNPGNSPDYINSLFDESILNYKIDNTIPFQQPSTETTQCIVFVHGWNMDYNEYLNFSEAMFKRLYWQGYQGRFCAFRWATLTSPTSYNTSEFRAWKYGLSLKMYVESLKASLPGYSMNLAAHSMGNIVAGSALSRGLTINNYALLQAAVPAGCYDTSEEINDYTYLTDLEGKSPTPDYASPDLGYRGELANVSGNVSGKLYNFYNVDDFALATGNLGTLWHVPFLWWIATNWEANEHGYKPDYTLLHLKYYGYTPSAPSGQQGWLSDSTQNILHYVTDPHEMMSFIARPRSQAVGAMEGVSGSVGGEVNIGPNSSEKFGRERPDHSGEFNRPPQQLTSFYHSLLNALVP